jgi:hypothetical protein
MSKQGLRARQAARWPRISDRLDERSQPPEPTRESITKDLEYIGRRRFLQLRVPRSSAPRAKRVTLLRGSGPLSAEGKPLAWDPRSRSVTGDWAVADLREWLASMA